MAGDTLRGIGKKAIAEALEAAAAAERASEQNGTTPPSALAEEQGRPERSLDELPSERTGLPEDVATNHTGNHGLTGLPITTAPTLVQDAPEPAPGAATLPGTSTLTTAATTVVDDAAPLGSASSSSRSGPNRVSFGTMIGHEMHAVQARVASAVAEADAAARGTAHGHDVHLPAHPAMAGEPEAALVVAPPSSLSAPASHAEPASVSSDNLAPARDSLNEFSGGDHGFFSTEPINDEYEPENPRGRLYTRLAVSGAVVAVVSVVVVAWVNSHSASEEPPVQVKSQPAVTATAPVRTAVAPPARPAPPPQEPPTSTIPSSMPERIAVTTPPPRPANAPSLAPPAPATAPRPAVPVAAAAPAPKPAPAAAPPAPKPVAVAAASAPKPAPVAAAPAPRPAPVAAAPAPVHELRTPPPAPQKKPTAVAAAAPHPPAPPAPHAAAPATPPAPTPRPTPTVAKAPQSAPSRPVAKAAPARASKAPARGKQKYDPDGTLPLSFE